MITQKLTRERDTKNTVVYKAAKGSPVDTLYIQKDALPAVVPDTIEIEVKALA